MKRLACVMLVLGLAGCSSMKINSDHAQEADFSKYKTFQYHAMEEATIADTDSLADQRLIAGIKSEMKSKGLSEVSSNPDVYVTYHGEDKENVTMNTTHMNMGGYGMGPGWGWGGRAGMMRGGMGMGGMGTSTTQVRTYTSGTLIVDIWDAKEEHLVWRGVASDTLSDNPKKNAEKINKALSKMFERYPPA